MPDSRAAGGCGCGCSESAANNSADAPARPDTRVRLVAGAEQLGIEGYDLTGLLALSDSGDCPATQARMARLVGERLTAAQERAVSLVEEAAATQTAHGGDRPGMPGPVVDLHHEIVTLTAAVARLQSASARLADPPTPGECTDGCACVTAAAARITPRIPASRAALDGMTESDLVCTLDGGLDAMRGRISEWDAVIARSSGREAAEGGVTLVYEYDPALTVELARLGAAEFACCSFFTFTLTVGPPGMRFTVTAPEDARDVITAVFGAATPAPAGGR